MEINSKDFNFADELKTWRYAKGLSQPDAALRLGVALGTLRNWEQNRRMPHGRHLMAILTKITPRRTKNDG